MECTIVSIYPRDINMIELPGLFPGRFNIAHGSYDKPSCTIIKNSKHYVDVGEDRPKLTLNYSANEIAESIVEDFIRGKQCCTPGSIQPGLFWVEGIQSPDSVRKNHKAKLDIANEMQKLWGIELIRISDDDWSKRPGAHRLITDDARSMARLLNVEKPWIADIIQVNDTEPCKFCFTQVRKEAIICYNCKNVLKEEYKGLQVPVQTAK